MPTKVNREAGWREVCAEVSMVDLGGQLKSVLLGMCLWAVWIAVWAGIDKGVSAAGVGFHVPSIIWIAATVFGFVVMLTSERSYHEWTVCFFFPKLGFLGWLAVTAYFTIIIEACRLTKTITDGLGAAFCAAGIYFLLIAPGVLLLGLLGTGYDRVMEKRKHGTDTARFHEGTALD